MRHTMMCMFETRVDYNVAKIQTCNATEISGSPMHVGGQAFGPTIYRTGGKALTTVCIRIGDKALKTVYVQIGGKALRPTLYRFGGKALRQLYAPILAARP